MNMYIFANSDADMCPGRLAAQVGHVVQVIIEELLRDEYETTPTPVHCIDYLKWKTSPTKIILAATESQLLELMKQHGARAFYDTVSDQRQLTAVGFLPGSINKSDVRNYRLI